MNKKQILEYLSLASRATLAIVFIFFAMDKITDPATFAKEIVNYQILPLFTINLLALVLPWLELVLGFMLLAGVRLKISSLLTAILLVVFMAAVGIAMARGLDISCGCSGPHSQKVGFPKLLENTGLLILCAAVYFLPSKWAVKP